jgi:hypothetical protein
VREAERDCALNDVDEIILSMAAERPGVSAVEAEPGHIPRYQKIGPSTDSGHIAAPPRTRAWGQNRTLAPASKPYSITSSAASIGVGGTARLNAVAVVRLMQTRISWIAPSEDRPGADRPMIRDVLDPRNVAPAMSRLAAFWTPA